MRRKRRTHKPNVWPFHRLCHGVPIAGGFCGSDNSRQKQGEKRKPKLSHCAKPQSAEHPENNGVRCADDRPIKINKLPNAVRINATRNPAILNVPGHVVPWRKVCHRPIPNNMQQCTEKRKTHQATVTTPSTNGPGKPNNAMMAPNVGTRRDAPKCGIGQRRITSH